MHVACTRHDTFLISLVYMYACARKIDDKEALVQSIYVYNRCVHDNLHEHLYISIMYISNLVCTYIEMHINCKPKRTV